MVEYYIQEAGESIFC